MKQGIGSIPDDTKEVDVHVARLILKRLKSSRIKQDRIMRKIFTFLTVVLFTVTIWSQSPEKMTYQAVIRDALSKLVANKPVGIRISILQGSATGAVVYTETQTSTTNANGLLNIEIGSAIPITGIDWASGIFFLKTEIDPDGGTNYIISGTSQILSVPFAMYAEKAGNGFSGDYDDLTNKPTLFDGNYDNLTNKPSIPEAQVQTDWSANSGMGVLLNKPANIDEDKTDDVTTSGNQTIEGNKTFTGVTTVATPVNSTDAATKAYVDGLIGKLYAEGALRLKDIEGNYYNTVKIGNQIWMAENLKTTHYSDGTVIPLVNNNSLWDALTSTDKAYCWYNDDIGNKSIYGALYTWAAAMNGASSAVANPSGIQGVCPTGWHLPSDAEWTQLTTYLGGESVAGGKLKETGTTHWAAPNTGATNETGFTGLPGGDRIINGTFYGIGLYGHWWSTTENNTDTSWSRYVGNANCIITRYDAHKAVGFSVRCVRD